MTQTEAKHTPLPWFEEQGCVRSARSGRIAKMDQDNPDTAPTERDANAAFIVRACNAHDDLLAACKTALDTQDRTDGPYDLNLCTALRAAIAKAERGE